MQKMLRTNAPFQYSPGLVSFSVNSQYMPGLTGLSSYGTGTPSTTATRYYTYFTVPTDAVISGLALYLATGQTGAKARLGVYSNVNALPTALLADFGEVDLSGSAGIVEATSTTLRIRASQGGVWICTFMKNVATQATINGCGPAPFCLPMTAAQIAAGNSIRGYTTTGDAYGALPSTVTSPATTAAGSNAVPLAYVKIQ